MMRSWLLLGIVLISLQNLSHPTPQLPILAHEGDNPIQFIPNKASSHGSQRNFGTKDKRSPKAIKRDKVFKKRKGAANDHVEQNRNTDSVHRATYPIMGMKIIIYMQKRETENMLNHHYMREKNLYDIMRSVARPNELVVDVGSNHGMYALTAAGLGASVIAVEPNPILADCIRKSIEANSMSSKVMLEQSAIIMNSGSKVSMIDTGGDGGIGNVIETEGKITTKSITEIVASSQKYSNTTISFLKIDVEGRELEALYSASDLFKQGRVRHIIVEFGPPLRWKNSPFNPDNAQTLVDRGVKVLQKMDHMFGFDVFLEGSFVSAHMKGLKHFNTLQLKRHLVNTMDKMNVEGYIHFILRNQLDRSGV